MEQENVKIGDTIKILWVDDCGYDTVVNSYIGREGVFNSKIKIYTFLYFFTKI